MDNIFKIDNNLSLQYIGEFNQNEKKIYNYKAILGNDESKKYNIYSETILHNGNFDSEKLSNYIINSIYNSKEKDTNIGKIQQDENGNINEKVEPVNYDSKESQSSEPTIQNKIIPETGMYVDYAIWMNVKNIFDSIKNSEAYQSIDSKTSILRAALNEIPGKYSYLVGAVSLIITQLKHLIGDDLRSILESVDKWNSTIYDIVLYEDPQQLENYELQIQAYMKEKYGSEFVYETSEYKEKLQKILNDTSLSSEEISLAIENLNKENYIPTEMELNNIKDYFSNMDREEISQYSNIDSFDVEKVSNILSFSYDEFVNYAKTKKDGLLLLEMQDIMDSYYITDEGQETMRQSFIESSGHEFDDAVGNTEYIKYCMMMNKMDWLSDDFKPYVGILGKIDSIPSFSSNVEVTDTDLIEKLKENLYYGYSLGEDGKYYYKQYNLLGEQALYYMDGHTNEVNLLPEDQIYTAFSVEGQKDAYYREYEGQSLKQSINNLTKEDFLNGRINSNSEYYNDLVSLDTDYKILNGEIYDKERLEELKNSDQISFNDFYSGLNKLAEYNLNDIDKLLADIKSMQPEKDGTWNFSLNLKKLQEDMGLTEGEARAYVASLNASVIMNPNLLTTSVAFANGVAKFGEQVCDAIKTLGNSNLALAGNDVSSTNNVFDILDNFNKSYGTLKSEIWDTYVNSDRYNLDYEYYIKSVKGINDIKSAITDQYMCGDGGSVALHSGEYYIDGVYYQNYDHIPDNILKEKIDKLGKRCFDKFKINEFSLNDTSASNQYMAALKDGIRKGGDFTLLEELKKVDNIEEYAYKQFDTMVDVSKQVVDEKFNDWFYEQNWYQNVEDLAFIKHDNMLGMTVNQIGNMAVPVLLSIVLPQAGLASIANVASSAALWTSAFGGAAEESILSGASYNDVLAYSTISASNELLVEKMFGGIGGSGVGSLDKILNFLPDLALKGTKLATSTLAQTIKTLLIKGMGEGIEEVFTDMVATPLAQSITYMSDKTYSEIYRENVTEESLLQTFVVSFLSGIIFGGSSLNSARKTLNSQIDVLQLLYGNSENLNKAKNQILATVIGQMATEENGVSTTEALNIAIENVCKNLMANPEIVAELETLKESMPELTEKQLTQKAIENVVDANSSSQVNELNKIKTEFENLKTKVETESTTITTESGEQIIIPNEILTQIITSDGTIKNSILTEDDGTFVLTDKIDKLIKALDAYRDDFEDAIENAISNLDSEDIIAIELKDVSEKIKNSNLDYSTVLEGKKIINFVSSLSNQELKLSENMSLKLESTENGLNKYEVAITSEDGSIRKVNVFSESNLSADSIITGEKVIHSIIEEEIGDNVESNDFYVGKITLNQELRTYQTVRNAVNDAKIALMNAESSLTAKQIKEAQKVIKNIEKETQTFSENQRKEQTIFEKQAEKLKEEIELNSKSKAEALANEIKNTKRELREYYDGKTAEIEQLREKGEITEKEAQQQITSLEEEHRTINKKIVEETRNKVQAHLDERSSNIENLQQKEFEFKRNQAVKNIEFQTAQQNAWNQYANAQAFVLPNKSIIKEVNTEIYETKAASVASVAAATTVASNIASDVTSNATTDVATAEELKEKAFVQIYEDVKAGKYANPYLAIKEIQKANGGVMPELGTKGREIITDISNIAKTSTTKENIEEVVEKEAQFEEEISSSDISETNTAILESNDVVNITKVSDLSMEHDNLSKEFNINLSYKNYDYVIKAKKSLQETIEYLSSSNFEGKILLELANTQELTIELINKIPSNVVVRVTGSYTLQNLKTFRNPGDAIVTLENSTYTKEQLVSVMKEIFAFEESIPEGLTNIEKAKYAFDYLQEHIEYVAKPDGSNQTRASHFSNLENLVIKISTCQGFAHTYQTLLNRMGIECYELAGRLPDSSKHNTHAFNAVKIDGKIFLVDTVRKFLGDKYSSTTGFGIENIDEYSFLDGNEISTKEINANYKDLNIEIVNDNDYNTFANNRIIKKFAKKYGINDLITEEIIIKKIEELSNNYLIDDKEIVEISKAITEKTRLEILLNTNMNLNFYSLSDIFKTLSEENQVKAMLSSDMYTSTSFESTIEALNEENKVKVLSKPNLIVDAMWRTEVIETLSEENRIKVLENTNVSLYKVKDAMIVKNLSEENKIKALLNPNIKLDEVIALEIIVKLSEENQIKVLANPNIKIDKFYVDKILSKMIMKNSKYKKSAEKILNMHNVFDGKYCFSLKDGQPRWLTMSEDELKKANAITTSKLNSLEFNELSYNLADAIVYENEGLSNKAQNVLIVLEKSPKQYLLDYYVKEENGHSRWETMTDNQIKLAGKIVERIINSNSIELYKSGDKFADYALKQADPVKAFDIIESVFLKNNLPYVGKIFEIFERVQVNQENSIFNNVHPPTLKTIQAQYGTEIESRKALEKVIFRDLIRISLKSNNRSVIEYLESIKQGNILFEQVTSQQDIDNLTIEERKTLEVYVSHLDMLYQSLKGRTIWNEKYSLYDNIKRMNRIFATFNKNNVPDMIVKSFMHDTGFDTLESVEKYIREERTTTDNRNREFVRNIPKEGIRIKQGDMLKGISSIDYLEGMLQNGILPGEFVPEAAESDGTPLGSDWYVKQSEHLEIIKDAMNNSGTLVYGDVIQIVLSPTSDTVIDTSRNKSDIDNFDYNKLEVYDETPSIEYSHQDMRTGCSFADISYISFSLENGRDILPKLKLEIVKNGFYIPVIDNVTGQALFTPAEYDLMRSKMNGLSYYGINGYQISNNLDMQEVTNKLFDKLKTNDSTLIQMPIMQELIGQKSIGTILPTSEEVSLDFETILKGNLSAIDSKEIERIYESLKEGKFDSLIRSNSDKLNVLLRISELDAERKRNAINTTISEVLKEFNLELKTVIDGDITPGFVESIDTGSTGRGSNVPGDGDFDFTMRVDSDIFNNSLGSLSDAIVKKLQEKGYNAGDSVITSGGGIRYKGVIIEGLDTPVDIDISFVKRTNKVSYSTDMALADRYSSMSTSEKNGVIANIISAKQLLKQNECYKPYRSDSTQGGMGGVGVENFLLQNGGSLIDSAKDFISSSRSITYEQYLLEHPNSTFTEYISNTDAKSWEAFKTGYRVWDFGKNHFAELHNGSYPHDNFIYDNMDSNGYNKTVKAFEQYLISTETRQTESISEPSYAQQSSKKALVFDNAEMDRIRTKVEDIFAEKLELSTKQSNAFEAPILRDDSKLSANEITNIVLEEAYKSNNAITIRQYQKALYERLSKNMTATEASEVISLEGQKVLDNIGYTTVDTINGIEIKVLNGVDASKVLTEEIIETIKEMDPELVYEVVINNTECPNNYAYAIEHGIKGFRASATTNIGTGTISLWDDKISVRTMNHEYAHLIAEKIARSNLNITKQWRNAIKSDGQYVSEYASVSMEEDFAESLSEYMAHPIEFAIKFPERYNLLKENVSFAMEESDMISSSIEEGKNASLSDIKPYITTKEISGESIDGNSETIDISKEYPEFISTVPQGTNIDLSTIKTNEELIDILYQKNSLKNAEARDKEYLKYWLSFGKKSMNKNMTYVSVKETPDFAKIDKVFKQDDTGKILSGQPHVLTSEEQKYRGASDYRITLANSEKIKGRDAIKFLEAFSAEAKSRKLNLSDKNYWYADAYIIYLDESEILGTVKLLEDLKNIDKYGIEVHRAIESFGRIKPFSATISDQPYYGISMAHSEPSMENISIGSKKGGYGGACSTFGGYLEEYVYRPVYKKLLEKYNGDESKITVDEMYDEMLKAHKEYMLGDKNSKENIPFWANRRIYENYKSRIKEGTNLLTESDLKQEKSVVANKKSYDASEKTILRKGSLKINMPTENKSVATDDVWKTSTLEEENDLFKPASFAQMSSKKTSVFDNFGISKVRTAVETIFTENAELSNNEITSKVLEEAYKSNDEITIRQYQKALYENLSKKMTAEEASRIISLEGQKVLDNIGYTTVDTINGIEIKVLNGVDASKVLTEEIIETIKEMDPKLVYEVVINNTECPNNYVYANEHNIKGFRASATTNIGTGTISLWDESISVRTMNHEYAHLIAKEVTSSTPNIIEQWRNAIKSDEQYVSEYASVSIEEDFAESLSEYMSHPIEFAIKFPERYNMLKENVSFVMEESNMIESSIEEGKKASLSEIKPYITSKEISGESISSNSEVASASQYENSTITQSEQQMIEEINLQISRYGYAELTISATKEISTHMLDKIADLTKVKFKILGGLGDSYGNLKSKYNNSRYIDRITYTGMETYAIIKEMEALQSQINMNLPTIERAKQIYSIIVNNYSYMYSFKNYKDGHKIAASLRGITSYNETGQKGLVCAGYAQLYKELCTRAGIKCEYIHGFGVVGMGKEMHAWNVIVDGDKYIPVDVTWQDLSKWFGHSEEFANRHIADSDEKYRDYNLYNEELDFNSMLKIIDERQGDAIGTLVKYIKTGFPQLITRQNNLREIITSMDKNILKRNILKHYFGKEIVDSLDKVKETLELKYGRKEAIERINMYLSTQNSNFITRTNNARYLIEALPTSTIAKYLEIMYA